MTRLSGPERRRQIVEAAYAIIVEKGLAETATRDVTRKLKVGSGLLHHYFSTWRELRTEAVRTFVTKEIEDLERALADTAADQLIPRFADWMADDPGFRHWRLWLNAIEEARRDPELAEVVRSAYRHWHAVIVQVIERLVEGDVGRCADPVASAWRLCALIDGLAGIVMLGETGLEPEAAKHLLQQQFAMELQT
ncbi:TetR/AcrR family transcriptional regulator [Bauldia sp.]|uniref:TetR/AcrR family transcriptional regulator n=1 Tax=Bauldia sp. TaxID=2575872 RepID=UPI003BAC0439